MVPICDNATAWTGSGISLCMGRCIDSKVTLIGMPYQQQDNLLCKYDTHVKVALTMDIILLLLNDKLQLAGQAAADPTNGLGMGEGAICCTTS